MEENYFDLLRKKLNEYGYENYPYELRQISDERGMTLSDTRMYNGDKLTLNWMGSKEKGSEFKLKAVGAYLENKITIPDVRIGEMDVLVLDALMENVNWNSGETFDQLDDPKSLPYQLITEIIKLEINGGSEGKEIRDMLLYKHLSFTAFANDIVTDMEQLKNKFGRLLRVDLQSGIKLYPNDIYNLLNGRFVFKTSMEENNEAGIWYKVDLKKQNAKGGYNLEKANVVQGFTMEDAIMKADAQNLDIPVVKEEAISFLSQGETVNLTVLSNGLEGRRVFYIDPEKGILVIDQKESAKRGFYNQMPKEITQKEELGTIKISEDTTMEELWRKLNESKGGRGEDPGPDKDKGKSR